MTPAERWQRVQQWCDQAEALPEDQREAWLDRIPDAELRDDVRVMLAALDAEARASAAAASPPAPPPELPESIGGFRVTGLLGRGATGTVFAAERALEGATQRVAVKLLHLHLRDGESRARFVREQQMLATLDHPGICRIVDAGVTAAAQPYLVMDLVDGQPIGVHADTARLPVAERIRLIVQACRAVQAAHLRLIVHLDLKPDNLLVTADGAVKLLDFGTAKLLDPLGGLTSTRQMTPLYASPEQLRGEPVTTACDVYSLGLILHELLSGAWPFGSRTSLVSVAERAAGTTTSRRLDAALNEEIAARRSASVEKLRAQLRGDLDAIVTKAMAAEPGDRYASAGDFADDLGRYLDHRPVFARPQTLAYRVRKYAARNARGVVVGAMALVALAGALGYGAWQQRRALGEGRRAEAASRFLLWMIASTNPMYGGQRDMTVRDLVARAGERLPQDASLDDETASRLGSALGWYSFTVGREEDGARLTQDALARARRGRAPVAELTALSQLGQMALSQGRCPDALASLGEGQRLYRDQVRNLDAAERASFLVVTAQVREACERGADVLALTREAVNLARQVPDSGTAAGMPAAIFKALVLNGYSTAAYRARDLPAARQAAMDGLQIAERHPDGRAARIALLRSLAAVEYGEKKITEAAMALEQAADLARGHSGPFEEIRLQVMAARRWAEAGDAAKAAATADGALAQVAAAGAALSQTRWMILIDAAMAYQNAGRCARAAEAAADARRAAPPAMPPQWAGNLTSVEALCLAESSPGEAASARAREALQLLEPFFAPGSPLKARLEAVANRP
jgi:serine/threonine-protein kinase